MTEQIADAQTGVGSSADRATLVPIIVNGRRCEVPGAHIRFDQIVALAYPGLPHVEHRSFTVAYRRGPAERPTGLLIARDRTPIIQDEVFHVVVTDKS